MQNSRHYTRIFCCVGALLLVLSFFNFVVWPSLSGLLIPDTTIISGHVSFRGDQSSGATVDDVQTDLSLRGIFQKKGEYHVVLQTFTHSLLSAQNLSTTAMHSTRTTPLTGPSQADLRRFTLSSVPHHTLVFANTFVSLTNTLPRLPLINHCVAKENNSATERGITPSLADIPDLAAHRRKFFDFVQNGNYSNASKATHTEQGFKDFRKYTSWMFPESPPFEPSLRFNASHPEETCKPHPEHLSGYDKQRVFRIRNFCIKPMGELLTGPLTGLAVRAGSLDDIYWTAVGPYFTQVRDYLKSAKPVLTGNECYLQTKLIIYPIFQRCDNMCHVTMRIGSLKRMIQQLFPPKTHITIAFLVLPEGNKLCTDARLNRNISNSFAFYANMIGHDHFATWGKDIGHDHLDIFFPEGVDKDGAMQRPMCFREAVLWHNVYKQELSKDAHHARDEPGYQFAFSLFGPRVPRDKETMKMVTDMITGCFGLRRRVEIDRVRPVFVFALRTGSRFFTHNGLIVAALHEYLSRNNAALDVIEHTKLAPAELIARHVDADGMLGMLGAGMIWSLLQPPNSIVAEINYIGKNMYGIRDGIGKNPETTEYGGNAISSRINHISYTAPNSLIRTPYGFWGVVIQNWDRQNVDLPPEVFLEIGRIGLCFARGGHPTAIQPQPTEAKESGMKPATCFMDHAYLRDVVAEHIADKEGRFLLELARWFTSQPGVFQEGKVLLNPGAAKLFAATLSRFRRVAETAYILEVPAVPRALRLCPQVDATKPLTKETINAFATQDIDQDPDVVSRTHVGFWSILASYLQKANPRVMKMVPKVRHRNGTVSSCPGSTSNESEGAKKYREIQLEARRANVQRMRESAARHLVLTSPDKTLAKYMHRNRCEFDVEKIIAEEGLVDPRTCFRRCCPGAFHVITLAWETLNWPVSENGGAPESDSQRASILRFFGTLLGKDSWLVVTNVPPEACSGSDLARLALRASASLKPSACEHGFWVLHLATPNVSTCVHPVDPKDGLEAQRKREALRQSKARFRKLFG